MWGEGRDLGQFLTWVFLQSNFNLHCIFILPSEKFRRSITASHFGHVYAHVRKNLMLLKPAAIAVSCGSKSHRITKALHEERLLILVALFTHVVVAAKPLCLDSKGILTLFIVVFTPQKASTDCSHSVTS